MKDLTKVSIDLKKCTEEQRKHVISLLPEPEYDHQYLINNDNFMLHFLGERWWVINFRSEDKEELTYPEFIKLFEGGERENQTYTKEDIEKLKADKAELLEALETVHELVTNFTADSLMLIEDVTQTTIQKMKQ